MTASPGLDARSLGELLHHLLWRHDLIVGRNEDVLVLCRIEEDGDRCRGQGPEAGEKQTRIPYCATSWALAY